MLQYDPSRYLPTAEELPDSDDTPVDNEFQNLIPNLLLSILTLIWSERMDWFFGVDMGIYHTTGDNPRKPIVPDGFLSLGVERHKGENGRPSYIVWKENNVVPKLVLEVVSQTYGDEYDQKQEIYARLGVLYYLIYNPDFWERDKHQPFEVYHLMNGRYMRQSGEPLWIPEIGLGIGRGKGSYGGWHREWLYWYDHQGNRYPTPEELVKQERQQRELAQQQAEQERRLREELLVKLQERGINLEEL